MGEEGPEDPADFGRFPMVFVRFRPVRGGRTTGRTGEGDRHSNQGFGHLQPGFRLEPEIVDIWGLKGPHRLPDPNKKVEGFALHLLEGFGADRVR